MGKYMIFDLETETNSAYKRKANCFLNDNWVVMRGWKVQGDKCGSAEYFPKHNRTSYLKIPDDVDMLVGLNIKFDLLWELAQGNKDLRRFFKRGGKIWCCQYAEYLLGGAEQSVHMVSMDQIVEKYGGRTKVDEVKLLWEQGIKTSEIPENLLRDYLLGTHAEMRNSGDIGNTEKIFLGQVVTAVRQGQIKMIQDRMDGLLCTTEMEFNGLKVDVAEAGRRLKVLTADLAKQTELLNKYVPDIPWEFNWNSRTQVSALIFGGTVKYKVRDTYLDEETGELARYKATEKWPLFDGKPVHPDACGRVEHPDFGTLYYTEGLLGKTVQDRAKSGKSKGFGKFRNVDVPGELKIKWQERLFVLPGYTKGKPEWESAAETDAAGKKIYSTSGDTLDEVLAETNLPFLWALNRKNTLDKEIGTYYVKITDGEAKGMLTCVQQWDHMIHHKLNHTSTVTTRLSSNDPNLQNVPRDDLDNELGAAKSEVKKMFISRFTEEYCRIHGLPFYTDKPTGKMGEIDYSQLEVVVQGVLTGDPQLCQDLRDKVDFHCKRVSAKHHISYEDAVNWCKKGVSYPALEAKGLVGKDERTKCKIFSFQRAYGAGAAKIAITTGMPKEEVEELIENEDKLYPGVVHFNDAVRDEVNSTAEPFGAGDETTGQWKEYRKGYYTAPTGTRYMFRTFNAPEYLAKRGIDQTFSPTQLKNYPVQGTGGEFVQAVLGLLFRHFASNDNYGGKAFLVNTVHDCVWVDMHADVVDQVIADMIRIMESIPEYYNNRYGMNITVPFPVEAEVGINMQELEHWHPANDNHDNPPVAKAA